MGTKLGLSLYGTNIDSACAEEVIWTEERRRKGGWKKFHNDELPDLYSSANN